MKVWMWIVILVSTFIIGVIGTMSFQLWSWQDRKFEMIITCNENHELRYNFTGRYLYYTSDSSKFNSPIQTWKERTIYPNKRLTEFRFGSSDLTYKLDHLRSKVYISTNDTCNIKTFRRY
jgi:hypothetical protein